MTEPRTRAESVEVLDEDLGLYYWTIEDDRIGGNPSTAYAVRREDEPAVLIDPLPLAPEALAELGEIQAIVLTAASHQRSAWRLRAELEVPVWAPALAQELEEEPDERYGHSMVLPADLVAFSSPGAAPDQHTLVLDDYVGFVPDLVQSLVDGELKLTDDEYLENPIQARETVRLLLEQSIDILCPAHGVPLVDDVHGQLQAALEAAGELQDPDFVEVDPDEEGEGEEQREETEEEN
jgi:glyoxylase-like metal-dependent hydrolase (beta-lactamase superfamily II)